jgi:hypothetical protein
VSWLKPEEEQGAWIAACWIPDRWPTLLWKSKANGSACFLQKRLADTAIFSVNVRLKAALRRLIARR